jgi:hypothetical protein
MIVPLSHHNPHYNEMTVRRTIAKLQAHIPNNALALTPQLAPEESQDPSTKEAANKTYVAGVQERLASLRMGFIRFRSSKNADKSGHRERNVDLDCRNRQK